MKPSKLALIPCGAAIVCSVAACAVDSTPPGSEPPSATAASAAPTSAAPTSKTAGTVLATVTPPKGHTFVFGQSEHGDFVVEEVAPIGEAPVLRQEDLAGRSVADVFARVSGGAPAPEALANAPAASPAPRAPAVVAPPAREAHPDFVIPIATLTPTQQWFENNFCSGALDYMTTCDVTTSRGSINTAQSQWYYDANYFSYAMNDPSSTSAGAMLEYYWNGSSWQFDWISSSISPGNYVYEYWWNSGPVYRSSELANSGLGGLSMGGIQPDLIHALSITNPLGGSYFEVNIGGSKMKADWPNDTGVACYVGPIRITASGSGIGTSGTGENINLDAVCPPDATYNGTPWTAYCSGTTTGQTVSTTVLAPYFAPANCCASMGGNNRGC